MTERKIKIGVSSCLLGNKVRYDGEHQLHSAVIKLQERFQLIPFCPEMEIGLGVPRAKIQLVKIGQEIRCLDQNTHRIDYTEKLKSLCDRNSNWLPEIGGYILKTKSPSCGLTKVKINIDGEVSPQGRGIFAQRITEKYPNLPLIEEDELEDRERYNRFMNAVVEYSLKR